MKRKHLENFEKLNIKSHEKWFCQLPKSTTQKKEVQSEDLVIALNAEAKNALDFETRLYNKIKESKRDKDFLWAKRIFLSGTLSDKISAYTLIIQESPVYNLCHIETLINMVNTKGKRECLMATDALQELFINNLLAEDRKLRYFNEQPLNDLDSLSENSPVLRKKFLILWIFEDKIKSLYKKFINNLNSVSHDTVEKTKLKAITIISNLLKDNPEQEQFLLEHLVNKIGDPVPKVGSHVCYLLGQLIIQHPDMKGIVVQEVERLVYRSNLPDRAKYFSLCFLNQIILSHGDFELANHLIMLYFGQFKLFVKKGEVNTKMMSALLTGVARAYPYAKLKENVIMEQLDAMYRLVHIVSFNISIQALMLIFQVLDSQDSLSDRFYCALYRKLFDPALSNSSRQASLLNLVYKALKKDIAAVRVKAFVKRLLQVSLYQAPNFQCGILILLSAVSKIHPSILETKHMFECDSDSDEHYEDVPDNDCEENIEDNVENVNVKTESSWFHRQATKKYNKSSYDFQCRNPLYANADVSNIWELLFLRQSFHPSVSLFAHQFSNSKEIKYNGDPLLDFTTSRFLDRFVYRNPKKLSEKLDENIQTKVFGGRKLKAKGAKLLPVTSNEYLKQKAQNVPAEEQFIYQYLQKRTTSDKRKKDDSDIESVTSEDFQKLLDDIIVEGEGKDSLNFAKELGLQKQKKNSKHKAANDSEDESMNSIDIESDLDEDVEFEDEEFNNEFADIYDGDEDLCEEDFIEFDKADSKKPSKKKRKIESLTDTNILAAADEFAALLEDNANSKIDATTEQAFANKDNAGDKQIAWEVNRHRHIKGQKWQKKKKNLKKKRKNV